MKKTNPNDRITICRKNLCVSATGHLAEVITAAVVAALLIASITLITKSLNNN